MDKPPENKALNPGKDNNLAAPVGAPPASPAADAGGEKSWGDKYKHKALKFGRNVGVNFIVNFAISALGTYAIERSPFWINKVEPTVQNLTKKVSKASGLPYDFAKVTAEFFTSTQLLLCGGHLLLPPMKSIHDHRKKLEFEIGHKLDVLQESLGRGNAASKRNLSEYRYIKDLLKAKPPGLSDSDKSLLAKHAIGDNLQFNERPESWKHVLTARAMGAAFTTTLSFVLAAGSYLGTKQNKPWMDVKETYLKGWGGKFGKKYLGKIKSLKEPELLGSLIVLELLYTFASKVGFDHMEYKMLKKQEKKEADAAAARLGRDKESLERSSPRAEETPVAADYRPALAASPSALAARRKIIEDGPQDFRTREGARPVETGIALS